MNAADQQSSLDWNEGVPVARRFDDPYFSLQDGLAETQHVFLKGNGLPEGFADGFHIAELGFGTGLNLLCTSASWLETRRPGSLLFTSFEAFPLEIDETARALNAFPALNGLAEELLQALRTNNRSFTLCGSIHVQIIEGDARMTLPIWQKKADAWFLDGFSPAKNPELWEPSLMQAVAEHTNERGSFATYTAAGYVRRALSDAGFDVTRVPGFGRKRHMSVGRLRSAA